MGYGIKKSLEMLPVRIIKKKMNTFSFLRKKIITQLSKGARSDYNKYKIIINHF